MTRDAAMIDVGDGAMLFLDGEKWLKPDIAFDVGFSQFVLLIDLRVVLGAVRKALGS